MPSLQTGIAKYHNKKMCMFTPSFEPQYLEHTAGIKGLYIIGIYHPPQGTDQQFRNSNFIDQFTDLLTEELPKCQVIIIMGNINIHTNDMEDQDAQILLDSIAAFNLKQHVNILTHSLGHTLDLIIIPATYEESLIAGSYISDHRFIILETTPKPKLEKRTVQKLLMKKSHNSKMNSTIYQFWNA